MLTGLSPVGAGQPQCMEMVRVSGEPRASFVPSSLRMLDCQCEGPPSTGTMSGLAGK